MTTEGAQTAEKVALTDAERKALRERVRHNWPFEDDADTDDEITDVADGVAVAVERIVAARVAAWAAKVATIRTEMVGMQAAGASLVGRQWVIRRLDSLLTADETSALADHDARVREDVAREIEARYLGADFGRNYDGTESRETALGHAHDEALGHAARIARGES